MDKSQLEKNAAMQREFFDEKAERWRETGAPCREYLLKLLSAIPLTKGRRALDVACGTGVLEEALLSLGLVVDAVDISFKMIERARRNFLGSGVNFFVADFYTLEENAQYDAVLVFDSYPHFKEKRLFAEKCAGLLKDGGYVLIFFDQSKESINGIHSARGAEISSKLFAAEKEAEAFDGLFDVVYTADNDREYALGLRKKSDK